MSTTGKLSAISAPEVWGYYQNNFLYIGFSSSELYSLDLNMELPQGQTGSVGTSVASAEQVNPLFACLVFLPYHRSGEPKAQGPSAAFWGFSIWSSAHPLSVLLHTLLKCIGLAGMYA